MHATSSATSIAWRCRRSGDVMRELETLAAIARDAELPLVADEAATLAERLTSGRFFVACVGQFKRGKSTVLNALVEDRVLPVGVTPVTSAVTILRHGVDRRATVFYAAGLSEPIAVERCAAVRDGRAQPREHARRRRR